MGWVPCPPLQPLSASSHGDEGGTPRLYDKRVHQPKWLRLFVGRLFVSTMVL